MTLYVITVDGHNKICGIFNDLTDAYKWIQELETKFKNLTFSVLPYTLNKGLE